MYNSYFVKRIGHLAICNCVHTSRYLYISWDVQIICFCNVNIVHCIYKRIEHHFTAWCSWLFYHFKILFIFTLVCSVQWIDHFHNDRHFKYILCPSKSFLASSGREHSFEFPKTRTRRERLIKMYIKEYLRVYTHIYMLWETLWLRVNLTIH